jgi:hypothetical protein
MPVSLHCDPDQREADNPTLWQSHREAIAIRGDQIHVRVGNRGSNSAQGVTVGVWYSEWAAGTELPNWLDGSWKQCTPQTSAGKTILPGETETFGPFAFASVPPVPPAKRYVVLAVADCDDDRANTNPLADLECSRRKTPLIDLVAGDNNLALRVFKDP